MNRTQLVQELAADFHAIKNKIHGTMIQSPPNGITYAQQFALLTICQAKASSNKEISQMLCTSSSAATQLINELVKQGFVVRNISKTDRRTLDLVVSKKGKKQLLETKKRHTAIMSLLVGALSDAELAQFVQLNKKILSNL